MACLSLFRNDRSAAWVDVEGWYVYTVNSKYFYVLANSIKENSNIASGSFTSQPATFEASNPQPQDLTFSANEAAGTVKFSITGTNADKFSYSYTSGNTVTVKAAGDNTTSSAYTADLNLLSAAGDVLATVALKQSAPMSGNVEVLEVDFTAQGWTNQQAIESLTVSPLTFTFASGGNSNVPKYYDSGTSLRMYAKNSMTITGATIVKIEFTYGDRNDFLVNTGTLEGSVWTGSSDNLVFSIMEKNAENKSGQGKIQKMSITYEK